MASTSLRERKKERTRQALQDAALRLFAERGYDATTVEEIAAAVDVSPRTFFRYFPSKEDVVTWDPYDPLIFMELARRPPAEPALTALREAIRAVAARIPVEAERAVLTRLRLVVSTPALRARIYETQATWHQAVIPILAKRTGRPADDLEVQVFAAATVAALVTALDRWQLEGGIVPLADAADGALAALAAIPGLSAPGTRSTPEVPTPDGTNPQLP